MELLELGGLRLSRLVVAALLLTLLLPMLVLASRLLEPTLRLAGASDLDLRPDPADDDLASLEGRDLSGLRGCES